MTNRSTRRDQARPWPPEGLGIPRGGPARRPAVPVWHLAGVVGACVALWLTLAWAVFG